MLLLDRRSKGVAGDLLLLLLQLTLCLLVLSDSRRVDDIDADYGDYHTYGMLTTVSTRLGLITGVAQNHFVAFRGIPYALVSDSLLLRLISSHLICLKPPVGSYRWAPPVAHPGWYPDVLNATEFQHVCPQSGYVRTF